MKNIKKICLLLMTVFILGEAMASEAHGRERIIDPKVRAEKMTGRMVKKYVFNDIQKQQLLEVNLTMAEKVGERPVGPHMRHGKKGDMKKGNYCCKKDTQGGKVAKDVRERKIDCPTATNRPSKEEMEKRHQEIK